MGQNSAQSEAVKLKKDFVSKVFHYGPGCQDEHSYYLGPYTLNGLTCQLVGGPDHGCRGVVEFADVKFDFDPDPGDPLTPADKRNGIEWKGWLKMRYSSSRMRPFFRGDWQSWLKWQDKRYPEAVSYTHLDVYKRQTWDRGAALTSRLQTFETEMLAEEENFGSLARINRELIGKAEAVNSPQRVVLDLSLIHI